MLSTKKNLFKLIIFCFFVLSALAFSAEQDALKDIYVLYKKGAYTQALDALNKVKGVNSPQATVAYWKGLCHSRLQQFDLAGREFVNAYKLGSQSEDLYYEMGQAFYAANDLEKSEKAFIRSAKYEYKAGASYYYLGHINQTMEKHKQALEYYKKVDELPYDDDKVKQAALFQIGEIYLAMSDKVRNENTRKKVIRDKIIPQYEKARAYESGTQVATQAEYRIREVRHKYLGETGSKPWRVNISQKIQYDTNVVTEADEATVKLSDTASIISTTGVSGKYKLQTGRFEFAPYIKGDLNFHSRRTVPDVYQNDELSSETGLKNYFKHSFGAVPGTLYFSPELSYIVRDYTQSHKLSFYSWSMLGSLKEEIKIFTTGESFLKVQYKYLINHDNGYSAKTPSVSIGQTVSLSGLVSLDFALSGDFQRAEDRSNDLYTYKLNTSSMFRDIIQDFVFRPSFNFTVTDTRNQSATRGTELTYSPTFVVIYQLSDSFKPELSYTWTKKTSDDTVNYAYSKHLVSFGITFTF